MGLAWTQHLKNVKKNKKSVYHTAIVIDTNGDTQFIELFLCMMYLLPPVLFQRLVIIM